MAAEAAAALALHGGCHCRAVRFTVSVVPPVALLDCNCSICAATGYLHLIVDARDFALATDPAALTEYRFGTRAARHLFCATCGIKSFYMPRSHPGGVSVNWRALDDTKGLSPVVEPFDGRDWEAARSRL